MRDNSQRSTYGALILDFRTPPSIAVAPSRGRGFDHSLPPPPPLKFDPSRYNSGVQSRTSERAMETDRSNSISSSSSIECNGRRNERDAMQRRSRSPFSLWSVNPRKMNSFLKCELKRNIEKKVKLGHISGKIAG